MIAGKIQVKKTAMLLLHTHCIEQGIHVEIESSFEEWSEQSRAGLSSS